MCDLNKEVTNLSELKKFLSKSKTHELHFVKKVKGGKCRNSRLSIKGYLVKSTLKTSAEAVSDATTLARMNELLICSEWFTSMFDISQIRDGSFLQEVNRVLDELISFCDSIYPDGKLRSAKSMKRTNKGFILMIYLIWKKRQGIIRSEKCAEIRVIIENLDIVLEKAAFSDSYFKSLSEGAFAETMPIIDSFYNMIANELESYDNQRILSIWTELYTKFEDNEKRCTKFHSANENIHSIWYNIITILNNETYIIIIIYSLLTCIYSYEN